MNAQSQPNTSPKLLAKMAAKYSVDPDKMLATLKATAFKSEKPVSNEVMMSLLIVADQYSLNPWTREIYAFEDKRAGIVPVVSVDGWARILNDHPQFDGLKFEFGPEDERGQNAVPTWCECTIYRKDRQHPITVREYFAEVVRVPGPGKAPGPWQSHPRRMLRHKTLIQCARIALGFSGIYDEDEAQRIAAGEAVLVNLPPQASRTEQAKALLGKEPEPAEPPPSTNAEAELPISDERAQPPWPTE